MKPPAIAVAIAGFRLGHTMRMSRIIAALQAAGHRLVIYTAGEPARYLRATLPGIELHEIPCFTYAQLWGRIAYVTTAIRGTAKIAAGRWIIRRLVEDLKAENVQLALVDFEPFVPRAAERLGIPRVSINHQDVMWGCERPDRLTQALSFAIVQTVIRRYHPAMDLRIVSSFYRSSLPERFHPVGPVFRSEILGARERVEDQGFVLVYADPRACRILAHRFAGARQRFVVFTDKPPAAAPPNFTYRPLGPDFVDALRTCTALVSSSGHQLTSEALLLGKPILAVPQDGQYEERWNALHMARTGAGRIATHRDLGDALPAFLAALPEHREALARLHEHPDFLLEDGAAAILSLLEPYCAALS